MERHTESRDSRTHKPGDDRLLICGQRAERLVDHNAAAVLAKRERERERERER